VAAFNWVDFKARCPACSEEAEIRSQLHVAASFEGDDGRFCNHKYRIGDVLRWWNKDDSRYNDWKSHEAIAKKKDGSVWECCYATCAANGDKLYVIIQVSADLKIERVLQIGPEFEWPSEYLR
jgi:hypothetical protein